MRSGSPANVPGVSTALGHRIVKVLDKTLANVMDMLSEPETRRVLQRTLRSQTGAKECEAKSLADALDKEPARMQVLKIAEVACDVRGQLNELLSKRGLRPRLIGVLVPAVNFTRGGGTDTTTTAASTYVDLATHHGKLFKLFGEQVRWAGIGKVGYQQVFHLVKPTGEGDDAPTSAKIATDTCWDSTRSSFRSRSPSSTSGTASRTRAPAPHPWSVGVAERERHR